MRGSMRSAGTVWQEDRWPEGPSRRDTSSGRKSRCHHSPLSGGLHRVRRTVNRGDGDGSCGPAGVRSAGTEAADRHRTPRAWLPLRCLRPADASDLPRRGERPTVQYGKRIGAFVLYLLHYQLLPEKRLAALMADLFGVKLVTATIARISQDCAQRFQGSPMPCVIMWQQRQSSTWMKPASGLAARRSGCISPRPSGSPSTAPRPSAAACWRRSPALSCMTI